jgi:hypothetical protein
VRRLGPPALALFVALLVSAPANAASLHVVFPQQAEVTVVQGSATQFNLEVQALGATSCSATTAPVVVDRLYMVDRTGAVNSGDPADMPITTDAQLGASDNCDIHNPVEIPLTATAAPDVPVGDYTSLIRYGKGGDGDVDSDGPPLTIHVIAPPAEPEALPPESELPQPELTPPDIVVLGVRDAAPRPVRGKSVLLTPVKGSTGYILRGKAKAILTKATVVPNGTIVDARTSVVKVTVVRDKTGTLDSVDTWGGGFVVSQGKGARPITTMALRRFADASKNTRAVHSARKKKKHASQQGAKLWVNGKGNFKTTGDHGSAIVMGTYWLTEETSAGTKVSVRQGIVAVRDFAHKRTIILTRNRSYTATENVPKIRRRPVFAGSVR